MTYVQWKWGSSKIKYSLSSSTEEEKKSYSVLVLSRVGQHLALTMAATYQYASRRPISLES
jgi:hypothetical protein